MSGEGKKNNQRTLQKARSLASANREFADTASRNRERFQSEVSSLSSEISSIRVPRNAAPDVKEEIKSRRKDLKAQLEYAQRMLDGALKKSESLESVAQYYETKLKEMIVADESGEELDESVLDEESMKNEVSKAAEKATLEKAAAIAAIKAKQKADIKAAEEARVRKQALREQKERLEREKAERIAAEKEAQRLAAEKEAARVAIQEVAEREAARVAIQEVAEREAACVAAQEESERKARKKAEAKALDASLEENPGTVLSMFQEESSGPEGPDKPKGMNWLALILLVLIALALFVFFLPRNSRRIVSGQPSVAAASSSEPFVRTAEVSSDSQTDSFTFVASSTPIEPQVAEEAATDEGAEYNAEDPDDLYATYELSICGYTATIEAHDGIAFVSYPQFITAQEIYDAGTAAFDAYPQYLNGTRLYVVDPGNAILTYPFGYTYKDFLFATQMLDTLLPIYIQSVFSEQEEEIESQSRIEPIAEPVVEPLSISATFRPSVR